MENQSATFPVVPDVGKNPHRFFQLLLLSSFVILLVVVVFVLNFSGVKSNVAKPVGGQVALSSPGATQAYQAFLDKAFKAKNSQDFLDSYTQGYKLLSFDYERQPLPQNRKALEDMIAYLNAKYPGAVKKFGLSVPCKEEACGAKAVSAEGLDQLEAKLLENKALSEAEKSSIVYDIRQSRFYLGASNKKAAFNTISGVFGLLKAHEGYKEDKVLQGLASEVLVVMKSVESDLFQVGEKRGYYKII